MKSEVKQNGEKDFIVPLIEDEGPVACIVLEKSMGILAKSAFFYTGRGKTWFFTI